MSQKQWGHGRHTGRIEGFFWGALAIGLVWMCVEAYRKKKASDFQPSVSGYLPQY